MTKRRLAKKELKKEAHHLLLREQELKLLQQQKEMAVSLIKKEIYDGQWPHPEIIEGYKKADPKFLDFIKDTAYSEMKFVHEIEHTRLKYEAKLEAKQDIYSLVATLFGQTSGLIVAIVALLGGFWLITKGHVVPGLIIGGTPLVAVVYVLVSRHYPELRSSRSEEDNKTELDEKSDDLAR